MKTVNSLSGGKTSSYIAMNYPADFDVFAVVCIDSHNAGGNIDKGLRQRVNDKLQKHCSHMPEFWACAEDPQVLKTMFDLEQEIGREITWVRGMGWEQMLYMKRAIPNHQKRFCTTITKIIPIFEFLYMNTDLPVQMRIGYRKDEEHRKEKTSTEIKFCYRFDYRNSTRPSIRYDLSLPNESVFNYKLHQPRGVNRWKTMEWRIPEFPLIDCDIDKSEINEYWKYKQLSFAKDSNCLMCFWKSEDQLRQNFAKHNAVMQWSKIMENLIGYTFKDKLSLAQIENLPIQSTLYN